MKQNEIFTKGLLKKYYDSGKLDNVLKEYKDSLDSNKILGKGRDCIAFTSNISNNNALKLVHKKSHYFLDGNNTAQKLKDLSNNMHSVLPMKRLLYEDEYVFLYEQALCQSFSKDRHVIGCHKHCLPRFVTFFIDLLIDMFEHKAVCHQIGPGSVCVNAMTNDNKNDAKIADNFVFSSTTANKNITLAYLTLFDYHGIRNLDALCKNGEWLEYASKLIGTLLYFLIAKYDPKNKDEFKNMRHKYDMANLKNTNYYRGILPDNVRDILKLMNTSQPNWPKVIKQLKSYRQELVKYNNEQVKTFFHDHQ